MNSFFESCLFLIGLMFAVRVLFLPIENLLSNNSKTKRKAR